MWPPTERYLKRGPHELQPCCFFPLFWLLPPSWWQAPAGEYPVFVHHQWAMVKSYFLAMWDYGSWHIHIGCRMPHMFLSSSVAKSDDFYWIKDKSWLLNRLQPVKSMFPDFDAWTWPINPDFDEFQSWLYNRRIPYRNVTFPPMVFPYLLAFPLAKLRLCHTWRIPLRSVNETSISLVIESLQFIENSIDQWGKKNSGDPKQFLHVWDEGWSMIWSCDICDHYLYTYDKSQFSYAPHIHQLPQLKRYTYDDHPYWEMTESLIAICWGRWLGVGLSWRSTNQNDP